MTICFYGFNMRYYLNKQPFPLFPYTRRSLLHIHAWFRIAVPSWLVELLIHQWNTITVDSCLGPQLYYTGCSGKIVFFSLKCCVFFLTLPVLLQRWCSTCLVFVHTLTPSENRERPCLMLGAKSPLNNLSAHPPVPNSLCVCIKNYLMTFFLLAPCECRNIMAYMYISISI